MSELSSRTVELDGFDRPIKHQDAHGVMPEKNLLVVADGLSMMSRSRYAADTVIKHLMASALSAEHTTNPDDAVAGLVRGIHQAHRHIKRSNAFHWFAEGATGVAAAQILPQTDGPVVAWASVGDVRIYHQAPKEEILRIITTDEIDEDNGVSNCVGNSWYRGVNQSGVLPFAAGSRLLVASDGVFGGQGYQQRGAAELGHILAEPGTAQQLAERIVRSSLTADDTTAVVAIS